MTRTQITLGLFAIGLVLFLLALWRIGADATDDREASWRQRELDRLVEHVEGIAAPGSEILDQVRVGLDEQPELDLGREFWTHTQAVLGDAGVSPATRVEIYRPDLTRPGGAVFLGAVTRERVDLSGEPLLAQAIRAPEASALRAGEDEPEEDMLWIAKTGTRVRLHRLRSVLIEFEDEMEHDHDDEEEEREEEEELEEEEEFEEEEILIEIRPYLLHVVTTFVAPEGASAFEVVAEEVGGRLIGEARAGRVTLGDAAPRARSRPLEIESLEGRHPTTLEVPRVQARIGDAPGRPILPFVFAGLSVLAFCGAMVAGLYVLARPTPRPTDLTGEAAHEMRTPLTVMRGKLEVALRRDRDAAYYRQTLEECLEEVAALEQLQEAVLLLGRTRRSDLVQEDIDLRAIAEAEVARVAEGHPERDVSLAMNGAVVVQGDPSLLARAIGNLIDNAANHSIDGGAIRVSVGSQSGHARVVVDDDGPGVPPERHEAIFERFFRGPDVGRRGIAGSGLGLPIVRRIAELHGGTAAIEPAQGGRFVIRLPLT